MGTALKKVHYKELTLAGRRPRVLRIAGIAQTLDGVVYASEGFKSVDGKATCFSEGTGDCLLRFTAWSKLINGCMVVKKVLTSERKGENYAVKRVDGMFIAVLNDFVKKMIRYLKVHHQSEGRDDLKKFFKLQMDLRKMFPKKKGMRSHIF